MTDTPHWGPAHQNARRPRLPAYKRVLRGLVCAEIFGLFLGGADHLSAPTLAVGFAEIIVAAWIASPRSVQRATLTLLPRSRLPSMRARRRPVSFDEQLLAARQTAFAHGGGVYLGAAGKGPRYARPQRAVLVLGPPRSGKSSSVIIPALIAHAGPAVSASTKPDVARATIPARCRHGRVWRLDPTNADSIDPRFQLRWSPVTTSISWDGALLMARAMTSTVGAGTTEHSHWSHRAQALLAPLLHAAAVHGRDMEAVVGWVMRHELDEAGVLLEDERCATLAFNTLIGLHHTEDRERSSIFSAAADALQAYISENALKTAADPNFNADAFVRSQDTVYIYAPAEEQAAVAPIVCGLLSEIRRATYRAHAAGQLTHGRMLFALDEVANIAPLEELPQIASEGGGQGLMLIAALQDLSQARQRWGAQADGFLTLFGTKLILRGVAETRTLEAISTMLGEYDRRVISHTNPTRGGILDFILSPTNTSAHRATTTSSTQRTRVLSPGEIARIPAGRALHLDGVHWELLDLTPAHSTEPWRTLTTVPA
jgi:type IV secretion system protein VirD4